MKRIFDYILPWLFRLLGFMAVAVPVSLAASSFATSSTNGFVDTLLSGVNWISNKLDSLIQFFGGALDSILNQSGGNPWFLLGAYIFSLDVWLSLIAGVLVGITGFLFYTAFGLACSVVILAIGYLSYRIVRAIAKALSAFGNTDGPLVPTP